jgi:four helix bundle protein
LLSPKKSLPVAQAGSKLRFLRLEVWQEGRQLYRMVSRLVRRFPKEELFGLVSQMRRSARSVCANVAEGSGRNSDADFAQFVEIAYGSAAEIASDAFLACDEGYISEGERDALLTQVEVVIAKASGLYRRLKPEGSASVPRSAFSLPRGGDRP